MKRSSAILAPDLPESSEESAWVVRAEQQVVALAGGDAHRVRVLRHVDERLLPVAPPKPARGVTREPRPQGARLRELVALLMQIDPSGLVDVELLEGECAGPTGRWRFFQKSIE